jgi:hypothetical protein
LKNHYTSFPGPVLPKAYTEPSIKKDIYLHHVEGRCRFSEHNILAAVRELQVHHVIPPNQLLGTADDVINTLPHHTIHSFLGRPTTKP